MRDFYDILGVPPNATAQEIRSAYKKQALRTHPDRAAPEDKLEAEAKFRELGQAYEVLNDETNRNLYDRHKVWPPPADEPASPEYNFRHSPRPFGRPFGDPFPSPFMDPLLGPGPFPRFRPFAFRDPFELFDSLFGHEFPPMFVEDISPWPSRRHRNMDPSLSLLRSPLNDPFFPEPLPRHGSLGPRVYVESSSGYFGRSGGVDGPRWVQESRMTRSINGVTQTVWKRKDADGHEHITYTYPDGTQRYTLDGIDQPVPAGAPRLSPPDPYNRSIRSSDHGHYSSHSHSHSHSRGRSRHPPPPPPPPSYNSYYDAGFGVPHSADDKSQPRWRY